MPSYLGNILLLIHATSCLSLISTPAPYAGSIQPSDSNYASPTTIEPTPDYKSVNPSNQYAYPRTFFEPLFSPNSQYSDSSSRPFLFQRLGLQSLFPQTYSNPSYIDQPSSAYHQPGYNNQPYSPGYGPQSFYDPHYPYPQKYLRNPFAPDCDYHSSSFKNTRQPSLFYPAKPDPYLDSQIFGKPNNALYRYQPLPNGPSSFASNIYN